MTFIQYLTKARDTTAIKEMTAAAVGVGSSASQGPSSNSDSFAQGDSRIPKLLFKKPYRRKLAKGRRLRK